MVLKKGCRAAFLVLGNLRLRNIAMRGPSLFFSSQSFPACVYKKRLRAWSSVVLIAPLLLFLLLARAAQMVFIFPGLVHLAFSLYFCIVVGHTSDLFGPHGSKLSFQSAHSSVFLSSFFSYPLSDFSPSSYSFVHSI